MLQKRTTTGSDDNMSPTVNWAHEKKARQNIIYFAEIDSTGSNKPTVSIALDNGLAPNRMRYHLNNGNRFLFILACICHSPSMIQIEGLTPNRSDSRYFFSTVLITVEVIFFNLSICKDTWNPLSGVIYRKKNQIFFNNNRVSHIGI